MSSNVCKLIREARLKKKMSYNQVAYVMHESVENMQNIEIDATCFTIGMIKKLAIVLDIDAQELISELISESLSKYYGLTLNNDVIEDIKKDTFELIK